MQVPAEYEKLDEFLEMTKQLIELYEDRFAGINIDKIRSYVITNKKRSERQKKVWDLKAVPMPIRLDCDYSYFVIVHQSDWDMMSRIQKGYVVLDVLHGIPTNSEEEGKILTMDMKDYAPMLRTLGPDYLLLEDGPDPFEGKIKWAEPPEDVFNQNIE